MAKDMLHGHFETFFWGQEYGGSQEALIVAGLKLIGLPLRWAGEITTIGLSGLAAGLIWRVSRYALGSNAALLAGSLYWSSPIAFVWLSQKERGFYESSAVSCVAVLLFATRYLRNERRFDLLAMGVAVGSAIWSSPQSFYLLVPTAAWLTGHLLRSRRWHLLRAAPYGVLGGLVGGLPWIWTNAHTRLASLHRPTTPVTTPAERLSLYWRLALPQVTGFKLPYDPTRWIGTRGFLVAHLIFVVVALIAAVMVAKKLPWVALAIGWNPIMFSALSTSFYVSEARYLSLLWPSAAIALAYLAVRYGRHVGASGLALLCGSLTAVGCSLLISYGSSHPGAFDLESPVASKVVGSMGDLGVRYAYAEYWSSYTLEVESGGEVVASPLTVARDPRRENRVRSAQRVAYILYSNGCAENALNAAASAAGQAPPKRLDSGGLFSVVVPQTPIPPESVLRSWAEERGQDRPDLPDCPA